MYALTKLDNFAKGLVIVTGVALARCVCWKKVADGELGVAALSSLTSSASRLVRSVKAVLGLLDDDVVDEALLLLLLLPVVVTGGLWGPGGVVDPVLLLPLLNTSCERLDCLDKVGPSRVVLVDERAKVERDRFGC